jgi:2-dehydro-3-deoxyphosphooctonate aldolase (KDO 8-P synthase)
MTKNKTIKVKNLGFSNDGIINFIAGVCIIETEKTFFETAKRLKNVFSKKRNGFVLKVSFDKANRTSIDSYRGVGLKKGLEIIERVKRRLNVPVLIDVHEPYQAAEVAKVADILQIPAFLCRQTDLVIACAKTKKPVNVKKGQFLAPWDIKNIIKKIESTGNKNILLTERGTSFGYGNLVVDMKSIEIMKETGYPVIFDATHSVQKPGSLGSVTGGDAQYVQTLAKASTAMGLSGLFFETHPNPPKALSDGTNSLKLSDTAKFVNSISRLDEFIKKEKQ